MEFQSLTVLSMSLVQLFSLVAHKFYDGDEDCFQCEQDILRFVQSFPGMANRTDLNLQLAKEFIQGKFPESYPFEGDNYIPCLLTYRQVKEEHSSICLHRDFPLVGSCFVYPELERIVYSDVEFETIGDDYSDSATYSRTSSEVRLTFADYEARLRDEQANIVDVLLRLSNKFAE